MKDLKGTKTEKNLETAFAGESKATNKYTYYASKAKKDGYEQIAAIFEETARNEREHAKLWFKALNGGTIDETLANLKDAAAGENYEWTEMYAQFAKEAREGDRVWICRNCGHVVIGPKAPEVCPVCAHPKSFFEILADNY